MLPGVGPAPGKSVCSDSNWSAQRLQMAARKCLETMSGMILNRSQSKFAVKSVANEMWCLKAIWWPALTGRASIFDLKIFEQSVFVNNHLLCYWLTIHNSISKICLKSPIYVEYDKMYRSKVCAQEFWYFVPGLDIQLEQSENDNPALKKAVPCCETRQVIYHFFLFTDTNLRSID